MKFEFDIFCMALACFYWVKWKRKDYENCSDNS